jgi:hypothetical protein
VIRLSRRPSTATPGNADHCPGNAEARSPTEKLSQVLFRLGARQESRSLSLKQVFDQTQGRGYNLLLVILVLPFLTPISLPLISTPFGLTVALIGGRIALGRSTVFPVRLLDRPLPPKLFPKLLRAGSRLLRFLEYFARPRLDFVHGSAFFKRLSGALIAISGLLLLLPLPIPFTNFFPGLSILLLAVAALERDGLCLVAGWFVFMLTAVYFTLLTLGGRQIAERLIQFI